MFGKKSPSPQPSLGPLENAVMQVLWKRGTATADHVRQSLEVTRPVKDSTIRTLLKRLEEKKMVAHEVQGRTFIYRPLVAAQNVATQAVRGIIERFCAGSVEDLLTGMVDGQIITTDKLRKLADTIAEEQQKSTKLDKPGKPKRGSL